MTHVLPEIQDVGRSSRSVTERSHRQTDLQTADITTLHMVDRLVHTTIKTMYSQRAKLFPFWNGNKWREDLSIPSCSDNEKSGKIWLILRDKTAMKMLRNSSVKDDSPYCQLMSRRGSEIFDSSHSVS